MTSHLTQLLRGLQPRRNAGVYAFVTVPAGHDMAALQPLAIFHEPEGTTGVVALERAQSAGLPIQLRAAWLTLAVPSRLDDVGLTAAVARALADAGIACNVIAAVHHDHLFVPVEQADAALAALSALQHAA
jgi:hypothetical protein